MVGELDDAPAAACPRCATPIALHRGRPFVTATGAIELWHSSCWDVRHARGVEAVTVVAPPSRLSRPVVRWISGAAVATAVIAGIVSHRAWAEPTASLAALDLDEHESAILRSRATVREIAPPRPAVVVPTVNGEALDELFPSLLDWTHPVTGSAELMPAQPSRHFGAERIGIERPECGAGHCGVDLDGPRGRPVVAVADGVVVRVEHHELGLDGRSGRYVRIEHDDGTLTAYMHLDAIAEGLEVGDHVDGGQYIGTLGATAVYAAAPHLHFSLEVPRHPGHHGDNVDTRYIDPAPFLLRATIAAVPERKHAVKPAM